MIIEQPYRITIKVASSSLVVIWVASLITFSKRYHPSALFNFFFLISLLAASFLLSMNDNRTGKTSRERSDSPFSFPRQRRSVRPRLYLSIESDSE